MKTIKFKKTIITSLVIILGLSSVVYATGTNIFPESGNVGIGTTTPSAKLDITNVGNQSAIEILRTGGQATIRGSNHLILDGKTSHDGVFIQNYNAGNVFLAKAGGKVGIRTTNPTEALDVNGNIKFKSILKTNNRMHIMGGEKLYLLNKDGVIIGKEWGGNGNLSVQGNISTNGNLVTSGDVWVGKGTGVGHVNSNSKLLINTKYWNDRYAYVATAPENGRAGLKFQTFDTTEKIAMTIEPDGKIITSGDIKLGGNIVSDGDICIGKCN